MHMKKLIFCLSAFALMKAPLALAVDSQLPNSSLVAQVKAPPLPPKPAAGSNWESVDTYNQELVLWVKDNASVFNTRQYDVVLSTLSTLRTQDIHCTDIAKLNQLADQAQSIVTNPPVFTPTQVEAYNLDKAAQESAKEILESIGSVLVPMTTGENMATFATNAAPILQKEVPTVKDPTIQGQITSALSDSLTSATSINAALAKLASVKSTLGTDETEINSLTEAIHTLEQSITGKDPQKDAQSLLQMKTDQTTLDNLKAAVDGAVTYAEPDLQLIEGLSAKISNDINLAEKYLPGPGVPEKNALYVDVTYLTSQLGRTPSIDDFKTALHSWYMGLQAAGVGQITLSFAQVQNLLLFSEGQPPAVPQDDLVTNMLATSPDAFTAVIEQAHADNIKVFVSFGGGSANGTNWTLPTAASDPNPTNTLCDIVKKYNIDGCDFDIELNTFAQTNTQQAVSQFFGNLYTQLGGVNKSSTLACMGSIADWPQGDIKELFYSGNNVIFNSFFNGLNLMLYSDTAPYINPDDRSTGWALTQWIDIIGKTNVHKIHVGFDDSVNYRIGAYKNVESNGVAAARMYKDALAKLAEDNYPNDFGSVFFWPALSVNPYSTLPVMPSFMIEFYQEMMSQ